MAATDPELKGGGVPLGSRRWCSGPIQQKKRPDLGLACHVEPDRPNSCCCIGQECAVPKITCDVSDRKPAPTCQEKKILEFFLSSRPEHNQKPPTDTANRHCAFIPTRRKIAVWPQGAQSTAPLARGRSPSCPTAPTDLPLPADLDLGLRGAVSEPEIRFLWR